MIKCLNRYFVNRVTPPESVFLPTELKRVQYPCATNGYSNHWHKTSMDNNGYNPISNHMLNING
jgi:hypothetical protein